MDMLLRAQMSEVVYYNSEGMENDNAQGSIESFGKAVQGVYVSFDEVTGSLIISFKREGDSLERRTLVSDALVLVTLSGNDVLDLEVLFDNKDVVRQLARSRFRTI